MSRSRFWRSLGILLGCLISSCSINLFLIPNHRECKKSRCEMMLSIFFLTFVVFIEE